jgi:hypothetical protein
MKRYFFLLVGLCISLTALLAPALINGYPLLNQDTATYLYSGKEGFLPADRPYYYGLFVRHISLSYTLWLVIIVQAIIVFFLLLLFLRKLVAFPFVKSVIITTLIIIILAFASSLAVFTSYAMADLFTGLGFIALFMILFFNLSLAEKIFCWIIFLFSLSSHLSNVLTYAAVLFMALLYTIFNKFPEKIKQIKKLLFLIAITFFWIPSLNFLFFQRFILSEAGNVFIAGKLAQEGLLQRYLSLRCPNAPKDLCEADSIPHSAVFFIWDMRSPVFKNCPPPSKKNENEAIYVCFRYKNPIYKKMIGEILSDNEMGPETIKTLSYDWLRQLVHYKSEDQFFDSLPKQINSGVYGHIQFMFPNDVKQVKVSKQFNGAMDFTILNKVSLTIIFVSCGVALLFMFYSPVSRNLYYHLLILLLANAAVCGCLSDVLNRYQARIMWLLPFVTIVIALTLWTQKRKHIDRTKIH